MTKRPDVAQRNIENTLNLTGKKFGRLTVKEQVGSGENGAIWHCECKCSGTVDVSSDQLRRKVKPTRSCGCIQREKAAKHMKKVGSKPSRFIDLSGQTIGKFEVLKFLRFEDGIGAVYQVRADGKVFEKASKYLRRIQKE